MLMAIVTVLVSMAMLVRMRLQSVRNQMQKRVAEEAAAGETQQNFEQRFVFAFTIQRDEEEDEKGSDADDKCRRQSFDPQTGDAHLLARLTGRIWRLRGRLLNVRLLRVLESRRFGCLGMGMVAMVVVVVVMMVPMMLWMTITSRLVAVADARQTEKYEKHEQP